MVDAHEIIPEFLYLGAETASHEAVWLATAKITHVLNIGAHTATATLQGLVGYRRIHVDDTEDSDLAAYFDRAIDFIEQARASEGRVLVHCVAGISRSPTVVAAYLIRTRGYTVAEALQTIRKTGRFVQPNRAFLLQLEQFGKQSP
jgi:protein-tyrosine phosphatase